MTPRTLKGKLAQENFHLGYCQAWMNEWMNININILLCLKNVLQRILGALSQMPVEMSCKSAEYKQKWIKKLFDFGHHNVQIVF